MANYAGSTFSGIALLLSRRSQKRSGMAHSYNGEDTTGAFK
jgi:hypothetical protein